MSTCALITIALLLWFIWRALDSIAAHLGSLRRIAEDRQKYL